MQHLTTARVLLPPLQRPISRAQHVLRVAPPFARAADPRHSAQSADQGGSRVSLRVNCHLKCHVLCSVQGMHGMQRTQQHRCRHGVRPDGQRVRPIRQRVSSLNAQSCPPC